MGQEVGHRWLAFLEFRDRTGQRSDALLGRDLAHWSFFFDSDASVMEGNDIEDLGGGQFRTVDAVKRYSLLDQYAMGLVPDRARAAVLLRREPGEHVGRAHARIAPQIGVTFTGTRRDVLIQDVHRDRGPASPRPPPTRQRSTARRSSTSRPPAASADAGQVSKLDRSAARGRRSSCRRPTAA